MKDNKKPSYWKTMFNALKEARDTYKAQIREQVEKHRLLSSHSDWSLLEKYIQECNKNPNLKVTIRTLDGTTIIMSAYKPERVTMDSLLNDITVEE